ncbi:hypothetical protein HX109_09240 [Galbibacter sp. BG1]|uniref:Spy/CpxP family protein refolding chaperone n=1 Tax=Galbibacter sp. BG1 TaxID=1170699 RepID=UPI0015BC9550|nr:hypothetical protein [Galbibacter sp. BG1]QLE01731.1 hypothetical protein HX109_09240 [Galbibacter sp. BG1]
MKIKWSILTVMMVAGIAFSSAQERGRMDRKEKREGMKSMYKELSADQIADLKTKKMALTLDLTESQQKDIYTINKDIAIERKEKMAELKAKKEAGEKPTADERYARMNERLDAQLEVQSKMKKILNEEQYKMWKRSMHKAKKEFKHHREARK